VPLADIIDIVFSARRTPISLEAANPRHAHEYTVVRDREAAARQGADPGVIESKSNFIEHPDLIAQRIGRMPGWSAARTSSRQRLRLRHLGRPAAVDPDVVWAKMAAMAEGARIATKQFWN